MVTETKSCAEMVTNTRYKQYSQVPKFSVKFSIKQYVGYQRSLR